MQGLIFAAGVGKRMGALTERMPKCLLKVHGTTVLHTILESFRNAGVAETIIVVGHLKERIKKAVGKNFRGMRIRYCENPKYASANNIYSLWHAKKSIEGSFIQCHGDLVLHPHLIKEIADSPIENGVVVDINSKHFVSDGNRALLRNGRITDINKKSPYSSSAGRAFGIYKFSSEAARSYLEFSGKFLNDKDTFEDPLRMAFKKFRFEPIVSTLPYAEIDEPDDIEQAEKVVSHIKNNSVGTKKSRSLRTNALEILKAGIDAVSPERAIVEMVSYTPGQLHVRGKTYPATGRIIVIGAGKASGKMALALEHILPAEKILGVVNAQEQEKTKKIKIVKTSHPLPGPEGVAGVSEMLKLLDGLCAQDIVICLISGGGSALLPDPAPGISVKDLRTMTELLLFCGAETYELQYVRKHCSTLKGGNLAMRCLPATVISLILSDVVNPKDACAAGPTIGDASTFDDALRVLKKYHLLEKAPKSILTRLQEGAAGRIPETPKPQDPRFERVENVIIADYNKALTVMAKTARDLGYIPKIRTSPLLGSSESVASKLKRELLTAQTAYLFCSETTLSIQKKGMGGRNQELVARLIPFLRKTKGVFCSIDSDGQDFLEGVSGAIVDTESANKAGNIAPYLKTHTTYLLHKKLDTLVKLRPTGTNVGDLGIFLRKTH